MPATFSPKDWTKDTVSRGDDGWGTVYRNASGTTLDENAYAAQMEQLQKSAMSEEQKRAANGVPTWMDVYNKHKSSTGNFNGKGLNSWQQDASHEALKQRIDAEYIANLDAYNKAKGANFQPTEGVLGIQAQPNTDWHSARDNIDNKGGVIGSALGKDWFSNAAKAAVLIGTGYAAAPALGLLGGAGGGTATGLAGSLGMNAGLGATALNAGALNTGMSLLRGQNIGDALQNGVRGAILAPVGGAVSGAVGGGTLGSIAGNAASGGVSSALRGGDVWTGVRDGAVNGAVGAAGNYVGRMAGSQVADFGRPVQQFVGNLANTTTQQALRGRPVNMERNVRNQAMNQLYAYGNNSLFGNGRG